ncbi:MAG: DUF853 family protein [Bacteroidales bacterium]|nr:DUF853 family protein [Bacteroidales bacterium]
MIDNTGTILNAIADGNKHLGILPRMANRHGLIAGATGTGKTCTLQNLAESFSSIGVPVFATDIKGDLSGVSKPGGSNPHLQKSVDSNGLAAMGFSYKAFPVCFWDLDGTSGHPLRTTVTEMGPVLLARLLSLNDTQSDVLNLVFRVADDEGLLLIDLKDLRKLLEEVGTNRSKYTLMYGNVSTASIGAIQRALLNLENQGGDKFFGEPAIDIFDFMRTQSGKGVINVMAADKIINSPLIYSSFLLYLLSELYEQLPEVGDLDKPKLVFFFDEAHLLFADMPKALLQRVEQVVRLIRSKGVGIYFCTQNPNDIPEVILGQLGNRIQHALRAFTPKDQKAVVTAAETFRQNPAFNTQEAITQLSVGEALVSFLDDHGAPNVVERAVIVPPEGCAGAVTADERQAVMRQSLVFGKYDNAVDRESAYEVLSARLAEVQQQKEDERLRKEQAIVQKEEEKARREEEKALREEERQRKASEREQAQLERQKKREHDNSLWGSLEKMAVQKAKREAVNTAFKLGRSILGSLLKK